MDDIITDAKAWVQSKLRVIEWCVMLVIIALVFYAGYHTRSVLDAAAQTHHDQNVIAAIPKVITKTNTIIKVIHDANDPCSSTALPVTVADELHKQ
jgi:hypothetical protein